MNAAFASHDHDHFVAELTAIAYRALLRQGLRRSFVDVELELWSEIRRAYRHQRDDSFERAPQLLLSPASY